MTIIFCEDPFAPRAVDADFMTEYEAAVKCGCKILIFSFESLTKDSDADNALKRVKPSSEMVDVIYRGWMLKPNQYQLLYESLLARKYKLVNSPEQYQNCHYLPDSYKFISDHTAKSIWIEKDRLSDVNTIDSALLREFGGAAVMVKDYVKSQKHYWDTACFIPSSSDTTKVRSVVDRFLELQGNDLNEGLVFREFIELEDLVKHSKSGMPLKQEYRLFFYKSEMIGCYDYWEEGTYQNLEKPPLSYFRDIAKKVESNFFTMDVAKTKAGRWIVIELGDGQVAGLPEHANPEELYRAFLDNGG